MGTALLHRVLGTQGEDSQVLQGKQQFDKSQVQLLRKDLTNLVALILQAEQKRMTGVIRNVLTVYLCIVYS